MGTRINHYKQLIQNKTECVNPIFVMGCPRSGTSLLSRSLACSTSACILEETNFMRFYFQKELIIKVMTYLFNSPGISGRKIFETTLKAKIRDLIGGGRDFGWLVGYMILLSRIDSPPTLKPSGRLVPVDYSQDEQEIDLRNALLKKYAEIKSKVNLFRIFFKDFSVLSDKNIVIEKSPINIYYIDRIKNIFPQAKFIFIWRDSRQVVSSYIDPNFFSGRSDLRGIKKIIRQWYDTVYLINRHLHRNLEDSFCMNYFEFSQMPKKLLNLVFEWTKLEPVAGSDRRWNEIGITDPEKKYMMLSLKKQKLILDLLRKNKQYGIEYQEYCHF